MLAQKFGPSVDGYENALVRTEGSTRARFLLRFSLRVCENLAAAQVLRQIKIARRPLTLQFRSVRVVFYLLLRAVRVVAWAKHVVTTTATVGVIKPGQSGDVLGPLLGRTQASFGVQGNPRGTAMTCTVTHSSRETRAWHPPPLAAKAWT